MYQFDIFIKYTMEIKVYSIIDFLANFEKNIR